MKHSNSSVLLRAMIFASRKHKGMTRKSTGEPYIVHPMSVSYIVSIYKTSKHLEELIAAAWLHDTIEDTDTTFNEIALKFSPLTASLVLELTSDKEEIKRIGKLEYLKRKLVGISNYALVIKLADRYSNICDNPTPKAMDDTVLILDHLEANRKLSKTQIMLIRDIRDVLTAKKLYN